MLYLLCHSIVTPKAKFNVRMLGLLGFLNPNMVVPR